MAGGPDCGLTVLPVRGLAGGPVGGLAVLGVGGLTVLPVRPFGCFVVVVVVVGRIAGFRFFVGGLAVFLLAVWLFCCCWADSRFFVGGLAVLLLLLGG